jgi:TolB protein
LHTALAAIPDGRIAFVSQRTDNQDIFVMNADGSDVTNLTSHPANDFTPRWSPDGTTIAFLSDRSGEPRLYTMRSDGSNPTQLTDLTGIARSFVWSPDSSQLAVVANHTGTSHISLISADGTNQRQVTDIPSAYPAWSSDGTQLAFGALGADGMVEAVYLINSDGTNLRKLFDLPEAAGIIEWSPDGSSFAFTTAERGIARIDADGSNFVQIVEGGEINRPYFGLPIWSPDSTRLLFLRYSYNGPFRMHDIYVVSGDGSGEPRQVESRHQSEDISWVSNEMILLSATTWISYVSNDNAEVSDRDIYLLHADTADLTLLTHNDFEDSQPDWGP